MDALSMLDDEAVALMLQLEEIESYDRRRKGKYRADNLPDSELACEAFQAEIKGSIDLLSDLRLAHSIAHAEDSDGQVIAGILQDEAQARQDRRLALTTDGNADVPDTQKECPRLIAGPPEEESEPDGDSDGCSAGPSTSYTSRQEEAFRAAYTDSRTILYLSRAIPAISACSITIQEYLLRRMPEGPVYTSYQGPDNISSQMLPPGNPLLERY
ncbi:hypothetical protein McanCB56680_004506 [Microsporum canis]